MSDVPTSGPHSFACANAACVEYGINKDALTAIIGSVYCGACGSVCNDLGPIEVGGSDG